MDFAPDNPESRDLLEEFIHRDAAEQARIVNDLRARADAGDVQPLYDLWLITRHPRVTELLTTGPWVPEFAWHLKVFRALESGNLEVATHGPKEVIAPLLAARRDPRAEVKRAADRCLNNLTSLDAIDELCSVWVAQRPEALKQVIRSRQYIARTPAQVRTLTGLLCEDASVIRTGGSDTVLPLVQATQDPDPDIRDAAYNCLTVLEEQAAIDEFVSMWAHNRSETLGKAIEQAGYVAAGPARFRVLSALKCCRQDLLAPDGVAAISALVQAAADPDHVIAERAVEVLDGMPDSQDARDALCRAAVEHGSQFAIDLAVSKGYRPGDAMDHAVFCFVAERWDEYESLDFDMSLLRDAYERAGKSLRDLIAMRSRRSGRLELVELVAGVRHKRRMGDMTIREWDVTLGILQDRHDWENLWRLSQSAPAVWAVKALAGLHEVGWSPDDSESRKGFDMLVSLALECSGEAPVLGMVDRPNARFKAHGRRVTALSVTSLFHKTLASASWDGTARIWRMPDGELLHTLAWHRHPVTCIAATPDGEILATACGAERDVVLWLLPEARPFKSLAGNVQGVACMAVSPDGRLLAAGCNDSVVRIWRLRDARLLRELRGPCMAVRSVAFSPDGTILAAGSEDCSVSLWTVPEYELINVLQGHSAMVRCLAFGPDGRMLASGSSDDTVILWAIRGGDLLKRLEGHANSVYALTISGDGRVLASGSWDGTVRLWILPEGRPWGVLEEHSGPVTCLAADPESRTLVSGSHDSTITMWNFQSGILRRPTGRADLERVSRLAGESYPESARGWLDFLLGQMKWRYRFDIELEPGPTRIEAGRFDIEIESSG